MTTKSKIIMGFSLMVILIAILAGGGFRSVRSAAEGFTEYDRLARFNIATSNMVALLNDAVGDVNKFMYTNDRQHIDLSFKSVLAAEEQMEVAYALSVDKDVRKAVAAIKGEIAAFNDHIAAVRQAVDALNDFYTGTMFERTEAMQKQLGGFTQASVRAQDIPGLVLITEALNCLAAANTSVSRYAVSRSRSDRVASSANIQKIGAAIAGIKKNVVSERGKQMMAVLENAHTAYAGSFTEMTGRAEAVDGALVALEQTVTRGLTDVRALNTSRDHAMREYGTVMSADSARTERTMVIFGVAGLVLGLVVAVYIISGISRALGGLAVFAREVASGNFAAPLAVREGGDIGVVIRAMQAIPVVLSSVMDEAHILARNILGGDFRHRMDDAAFPGQFALLSATFNSVGDAYTDVLDIMPVPIKTCDTDKCILFLNVAAQRTVGGNFVGEKCSLHVASGVCGTEDCFGEQCMAACATVSGEIGMRPQGRAMEAAFTGIPLKDANGGLAGYIEIINDVSEIKGKQNTMIRVATEASAIADRVAATSEQIAAQVEQISRGAEVQRDRVESTASAMSEMNSTVLEVARNAGQAADTSEDTRQKAESGAEIVRQVVDSIESVNTVSHQMQKNMAELGQQAENVGSVMNVISDIADQTNLLALNAAIEAARAGEAGRGFAVVADEVRKLAEKTMVATQEVGSSITAIQASTRRNMNAMEDAAKEVEKATALASSSGAALTEIVFLAADNSSVVSSIATAAEQQSATSEEINRAVEEINRVVSETTEGMTQSSVAVQELAVMTQELRNIITSLQ